MADGERLPLSAEDHLLVGHQPGQPHAVDGDTLDRGGAGVRRRIKALTAELDELWDRRRLERVGRLEDIDLLVEQSYARVYGSNFQDAVAPPRVSEAEDEVVALVA